MAACFDFTKLGLLLPKGFTRFESCGPLRQPKVGKQYVVQRRCLGHLAILFLTNCFVDRLPFIINMSETFKHFFVQLAYLQRSPRLSMLEICYCVLKKKIIAEAERHQTLVCMSGREKEQAYLIGNFRQSQTPSSVLLLSRLTLHGVNLQRKVSDQAFNVHRKAASVYSFSSFPGLNTSEKRSSMILLRASCYRLKKR